jgi:uncharacterized protein (TIRG00374 family)
MKKLTFTVLGWVISLLLLVGLAAKLDWSLAWHSLRKTNLWWILAATAINIVAVVLRALRWQWLMYTEKKTKFETIFHATMIGTAANNVLPARGGDWYRIYLLNKWEGVSRAALASMTGLEKLFDAIAILGFFALASTRSSFPEWVQSGIMTVTGVVIGSLIVCIILRIHHRRTTKPHEMMGKIRQLIYNLGAGMSILEEKGRFGITLIVSLLLTLLQIISLFAVQQAFGIILPLWVPVLAFVAINMAITIPSAPSGIGPFEVSAVLAYTWQGLPKEISFNIALLFHIVTVVPIVIIGAYYYLTAKH